MCKSIVVNVLIIHVLKKSTPPLRISTSLQMDSNKVCNLVSLYFNYSYSLDIT